MHSFDGLEIAGGSDIMAYLAGREFATNLNTTTSASLDATNNLPDQAVQINSPALA